MVPLLGGANGAAANAVARPRPSFRYKLNESIRRSAGLREHGMRAQVWQYNGKLAGYRLAERAGVSVPRLLNSSIDIDAITGDDLAGFGDRFVVKPQTGAYSRGVHLLVRRSGDRFHDLVDGVDRTWDEVVSSLEELIAAGQVSRRVVVEELLAPVPALAGTVEVPDDWKVYCCYDRPVVVMQRRLFASLDSSTWRFRYWLPEWVDLGAAMDPLRHGPDLEPPVDGSALIEAARAIGAEARAPFCRVDLYETDRGVVFGELTPHPGGAQAWRDDVDELLGREWEAAEARLMVEGVEPLVPRSGGGGTKGSAGSHKPETGTGTGTGPRVEVEGSSIPLSDLPGSLVAELAERGGAVGLSAEALRRVGPVAPPSFRAKLIAAKRQRLMLRTLGAHSVAWSVNSKIHGYDLARRVGVAIPELLHLSTTVDEIDPDVLPDRFVLKPHGGASSRGIHLLERHDTVFRDVRTGVRWAWDELVADLADLRASGAITRGLSIEELLAPPPERAGAISVPDDWKVHCFDGRPLLVMQRRVLRPDRVGAGEVGAAQGADVPDRRRFRYWTTAWDDLGAAKDPETHDLTLEPPVDGPAIVEAAARIGAELRVPFCRIDVYETDRGVVFGEITPDPGGPQRWRADVDVALGREWEAAEARLLAEGIDWVVSNPPA